MQQTASRQSTPARINSRSAPDCPLKERFAAQLSCFDTIPGCVQKTCIEREDTWHDSPLIPTFRNRNRRFRPCTSTFPEIRSRTLRFRDKEAADWLNRPAACDPGHFEPTTLDSSSTLKLPTSDESIRPCRPLIPFRTVSRSPT